MKFKIKSWLIVLLTVTLCGCSYFNSKAEKVRPTTREQQCTELKTTLTYSRPDVLGAQNPTKQAEAMKLYEKYDCAQFETND